MENENNAVWTSKVKRLLKRNVLAEVWQYPDLVDVKRFPPVLKTRLIDAFITESREGIRNSSSLSLFKELSIIYETAPYLRLLGLKRSLFRVTRPYLDCFGESYFFPQ